MKTWFLPYMMAFLAMTCVLAVLWTVDKSQREQVLQQHHTAVVNQLSASRARLEEALNERLFLVRGLAAYVNINPDVEETEFQRFASALMSNQTGIRGLQLAPNSVVTHVYPLVGNEAAIGHDLLEDPNRREAVQRAIDNRHFVLAGPVELLQGGVALIGRLPIFVKSPNDATGTERYWGLAIILVDLDPLLVDAGLINGLTGLDWALRGKDGLGISGEVFYGDEAVFQSQPEVFDVSLPNGSWQFAAIPVGGWSSFTQSIFWLWVGGGLIALLVGFLVGLMLRAPERLRGAVARSTAELSRSEERTRSIIETAYDAFIAMDADGLITAWNAQAETTFGWSSSEAVGQTLADLIIPPRYRERHNRGLERFLATNEDPVLNKRIEFVALQRDGYEFPVELTISPLRIGETYIFNAFVHDITERKRTEEAQQKARDAAIQASRAKSQFLANMSHEIRTPMNSIIGMAELLSTTPLTSEQQEYVRVFSRAGETLLGLIDDILDLSKVEAGQIELEKINFDLGELVGNTAQILAVRAHEKRIELNYRIAPDVPTALVGDPTRLRQVLINLAGNAIKFTEKGEVTLCVENDPGADDEAVSLRFQVSDTGIGIPPGKLDSIFDSFTQADSSTTREYGGTGLGLAICRQLVKLMGGSIWIKSEVGQGSTFYFTARFETHAELNKRMDLPQEDMKGLKTLIVDDNATSRLILRETLAAWGALPTEAVDGYQALAELDRARKEDEPYQLVLLDRRMPGMDGFQVAERINKDLGIVDMPVMMLTSDNQRGDIARNQELGVSHYLLKPVKRSDLLQAINDALGLMRPAAEEPPPLAMPHAPEDQRALRILLVEDSEDNRLLIQSYLKKTPYQIDMAENGEIAVEKFILGDYDLVLMDMQMPVMDGYNATEAIRKWESEKGTEPTPIIALTAYALKEEMQRSFEAGCTAHVTKPIKKAVLMDVIDEHTRSVTV